MHLGKLDIMKSFKDNYCHINFSAFKNTIRKKQQREENAFGPVYSRLMECLKCLFLEVQSCRLKTGLKNKQTDNNIARCEVIRCYQLHF